MDGYTVDEAATVLGIPQGRVWELLARGVLVGTPEGETGMRVFLKAERIASEEGERHGPSGAARGTNGNGGQRALETEMSPFRELLTEFRNLTERYGQALLALGEARGEVAALRSRVELLETRMDVALPSTRRISTVAWEMPDGPHDREARGRETAPASAAPESLGPDAAEQPESIDAAAVAAPAEEASLAEGSTAAEAPAAETRDVAAEAPAEAPHLAAEVEPEPMVDEQAPDQAEGAVEEPMAEQPASGGATGAEEDAPAQPRRERQSRISGLGSFADALARAQDPTLSQLPGATEAAEALADLQREIAGQPQAQDEVEAAEAILSEEPSEPIITEAVSLEALAAEEPVAAEATEPSEATEVTAEVLEAIEAPAVDGADELAGEPAMDAHVDAAAVQEREAIASPYSAEVVEPDWFADGDFTWLDAGQAEESSASAAEPVIAEEAPAEPAVAEELPAEPAVAEELPAEPTVAEEAPAEPAAAEPADGAEGQTAALDFEEPGAPAADAATRQQGEPTEDSMSVEVPDEAAPATTEPPWPDAPPIAGQRATQPFGGFRAPRDEPTAIGPTSVPEEELMFLGDEFEASSLEASGAGWRAPPAEAEPTAKSTDSEPPAAAANPSAEPEGQVVQVDRGVRAQVLELSDRELARLAADEGWDVEEVQAIRTFLGRPEGQEPEPTTEESAPPADQEPEAVPSVDERPDQPEPQVRPAHPGSSDSDWLHGRRGPAANAYRRLRRLFPG